MIFHFIKNQKYLLLISGIVVAFFISKISYLYLPFYWDEAWVYGPAVRKMALTGISLLPDSLPTDLYRGHPLLFHVLNATWLKIAGNTIVSAHLFNLVVSCSLIITVYLFGADFFSKTSGICAAFILCLQPVFLAQSTLVLPEVMVGLFSLLTLYFFLKDNYPAYLISAIAASLTKETGTAVIIACVAMFVISNFRKVPAGKFIIGVFKYSAAIIPLLLFLLIQKKMHGWYFFPEHLGLITLNLDYFREKFITRYITFTFLLQGRNLLFFSMIIAGIWLYYKKQKPQYIKVGITLIVFILVYSLIGSVNFFTKRYILSLIPVFILLSTGIIFTTFRNKYFITIFLIIFSVNQIQYIKTLNNTDHTLGFANAVKANLSMIDYCVDQNMKNDNISAYFILERIMTDPLAGYVEENEIFTNLSNQPLSTQYFIVSNYDTDEEFLKSRTESGMQLLKRFEYKNAWIELYKNTSVQQD